MAVSCEPTELAAAASSYAAISPDQRELVKLYLLAQIAGLGTATAEELTAAAKCYCGIPPKMQQAVMNYLLCQAVTALE